MTEEEVAETLRQKIGKGVVKIHFTDGEIVEAIIHSVSDHFKDAAFEIVSTNFAEKHGDLKAAVFVSPFNQFKSIS